MAQWSLGATRAPGFAPRLCRNRPRQQLRGATHNWHSVVRVREGLAGRDILVSSRTSDPVAGSLTHRTPFNLLSTSMSRANRGKQTLDHLYSTHRGTYKALPPPPFGKPNHHYILLIPAYKQKLKQGVPVTRSIRKMSDDADAMLQDCFVRDSPNGIDEYTTSVIGSINKCIDDFVPTVHISTRSHGLEATSASS